MTSHFSDRRHHVFSVASPVASNCLPAAGLAWAARLGATGQVVLCLLGDASARQGEFYEALAFALERDLPVVFVVEDNGYGISMPTRQSSPLCLGLLPGERVLRSGGFTHRAFLFLDRPLRSPAAAAAGERRGRSAWSKQARLPRRKKADFSVTVAGAT
ncbi:hypothetical protein LKL35_36515 [Streptomyces sp. ET3-23]|nr:hypothetical protein [Streptomyces sp. ET3-23]